MFLTRFLTTEQCLEINNPKYDETYFNYIIVGDFIFTPSKLVRTAVRSKNIARSCEG